MRTSRHRRRPTTGRPSLAVAALSYAAVLASYGTALALKHAVHLTPNAMVLAVAISIMLGRRAAQLTTAAALARAAAALAVSALAAHEIGRLLIDDPAFGDPLFVVGVAGAIYVRRFGPLATRLGTVVTLPFIAVLVTPALPGAQHGMSPFWLVVISLVALCWVTAFSTLAAHLHPAHDAPPTPPAPAPKAPKPENTPRRLPASTRMAIQMAVALGGAFAVGRALEPDHWAWAVITAYIVGAGNRGRADVLYKGILRLGGAVAGTAAATLLVGAIPPAHATSVVAIFVILGLASWLRAFNYAYWAFGITAALALLYGYGGQTDVSLLGERLEQIIVGAILAVAAAWLILPVRTTDVLRRRTANALAALTDLLVATRRAPESVPAAHHQLTTALDHLNQLRPALALERRATRRPRPRADAIDALQACRAPAARLTHADLSPHGAAVKATIDDVVTVRRRMGGQDLARPVPPAAHPAEDDAGLRALHQIRVALPIVDRAVGGPRKTR